MQIPLEIAFHRLEKPDWAEDEIRGRVDKLEELYEGLVGCRVRVDQRADPARTPPVVRIEMSVPGHQDLVVAYEPDRLQQKFQDPDLRNAIVDAFAAAERQLIDFKRQREGGATADYHDDQNQFLGQVAEMHADEDHGFLMNKDGGLLYFHRNGLLGGDFDRLKRGDEVHYVEEIGDTGPIATKVRPAASTGR
ncbi:MAG: HPF/RaiA family ribosome-associated protein [Rhizobiaceae bacterium]|nr:HPF/RaiA family ribosome-associated protein [Rhizobiaceae bacterium]MCV0404740.1 HPF/RaiA family ribosome-associated protein [Rhizobiaceae bacterium]